MKTAISPSAEQQNAIDILVDHCRTDDGNPFYVLKGPAGTGKTYCLSRIARTVCSEMAFTAPTNKAVRVLADVVRDISATRCTIYSLLGLQLLPNEEIKEIKARRGRVDLKNCDVIFVDEGFMLNSDIFHYILNAHEANPHLRWIFSGDEYQ